MHYHLTRRRKFVCGVHGDELRFAHMLDPEAFARDVSIHQDPSGEAVPPVGMDFWCDILCVTSNLALSLFARCTRVELSVWSLVLRLRDCTFWSCNPSKWHRIMILHYGISWSLFGSWNVILGARTAVSQMRMGFSRSFLIRVLRAKR